MKNELFKEISKFGKKNGIVSITQEQADFFNKKSKKLEKSKSKENYFFYEKLEKTKLEKNKK